MVFIDSNIPMYVIGAEHPHKRNAQVLLEGLIQEKQRLVTDAEVYQEILHRYTAIGRKEAIKPAFELLDEIVDECYPITKSAVSEAESILLESEALSARDAVHLATMKQHGITEIASFDTGFDGIRGIRRLGA